MTESFVQRNSKAFFRGKRAVLLKEYSNMGGETIREGETVMITGKNKDFPTDLNIENSDNVCIDGIYCTDLELIKE